MIDKKRHFVAILAILACLGIFPHILLSLNETREYIIKTISKELNGEVNFSNIKWRWIAFPHIEIDSIKIRTKEYQFFSEGLGLYPDWLSFLKGRPKIEGISLVRPRLFLLSIPEKKEKKTELPTWIKVKYGEIESQKGLKLPFIPFKGKNHKVSQINGDFERGGERLYIDLGGKTKVISQIKAKGFLDLNNTSYKGTISLKSLDVSRLEFGPITKKKQFPQKGLLDVSLHVTGKGLSYFNGELKASSNCLISVMKKKETVFSCGSLCISFSYKDGLLRGKVKKFEFKNPKVNITGDFKLKGLKGPMDRWWLILNAKGKDIDLENVRSVLLAFFSFDEDIRDYCNVVRSGIAKDIRLKFNAPAKKLHSLSDMYIEGYGENVKIYLPDQRMFLDSVTSSFKIIGGILHTQDAKVRLRNTYGKNGFLILGISDDVEQVLKVRIDVDADARDVRWALQKFVDDLDAKAQFRSLRSIKGRLFGKLILGDHKKHVKVEVNVSKAKFSCFYPFLGRKIAVVNGGARYIDDTLIVNDISGYVGKSKVLTLSGLVSWKHGHKKVKIDSLKAKIVANDSLPLFEKIPFLKEIAQKEKLDAKGILNISYFRGSITVGRPETLKYNLGFSTKGLKIKTLALPSLLKVTNGSFRLTNTSFVGKNVRCQLGKDDFKGWFNLSHRDLKKWCGKFELSGRVDEILWNWLEGLGLDWGELTPKRPFVVENLESSISRNGKDSLKGVFKWTESNTSVDCIIQKDERTLNIKRLVISSPKRKGIIKFLKRDQREKALEFSFKGRISNRELDEILLKNNLLKGEIKGDFTFFFQKKAFKRPIYKISGNLFAKDIAWIWAPLPLIFPELEISAKNGPGSFKGSLIFNGDSFSFDGDLECNGTSIFTASYISGSKLSASTVQLLRKELQENPETSLKQDTKKEASFYSYIKEGLNIELAINVDLVRFGITDDYEHTLDIRNLTGSISIKKGELKKAEIYSEDACGLSLDVLKEKRDTGFFTRLEAKTTTKKTVNFEDFLSCLDFKQDTIKGPFKVHLKMVGENDILMGNGKLNIVAKNGNINRFVLLSKIFRVINLVDLFSVEAGLLEGSSSYKDMTIHATLDKGLIHLEKAIIRGRGLNFYATGDINAINEYLDLILFIQPLKTIDKIITSVPIIGWIIGGKHKTFFVVPVSIKGNWKDPKIDTLESKIVTNIFEKLFLNVFKMPFISSEKEWDMDVEGFKDRKSH